MGEGKREVLVLNKALCISNTRKIRRAPRIQLSGVGRTLSTLGISWCCAEARRTVAYTVVMARQIPTQNPFLESVGLELDCALYSPATASGT